MQKDISMKNLVAGNWKMNGMQADLAMLDALSASASSKCDVLLCLPATLIAPAANQAVNISIGGQDNHQNANGAHTGDLSAQMLKDAGASYVILGHSERRQDHGETDQLVHAKTLAAWETGLTTIICVGETQDERDNGHAKSVVAKQLANAIPSTASADNTVIAYEPVWAIGTGLTPSVEDIAEMHDFMRAELSKKFGADGRGTRLLYGGSMKASNAAQIAVVENVNGGLVGGASLRADDFLPIISAFS